MSGGTKNRYYTLMIVPERSSDVRRVRVPAWLLRLGSAIGALLILLLLVLSFDYWYVMGEIGENRSLRAENRKFKNQIEMYQSRLSSIEKTLDRVKTFSSRLKVITNIDDRSGLVESLMKQLPDANTNLGEATAAAPSSDFSTRVAQINHESLGLELQLQDLYELLFDKKEFLAALPTRKPVAGYFTSGFGVRKSPIGGAVKMHEGLDIANAVGSTVQAPADGVVSWADPKPGYGTTLVIDHGYGLETWYGHLRKALVRRGAKVKRGEPVAQLGTSGRSTGPHVHYEVRVNGIPVDPLSYILEN